MFIVNFVQIQRRVENPVKQLRAFSENAKNCTLDVGQVSEYASEIQYLKL